MSTHEEKLLKLARSFGIETSYRDHTHKIHRASPESLVAVLGAWGVDAQGPRQVEEALRHQLNRQQDVLPKVCVIWSDQVPSVPFAPRTGGHEPVTLELVEEDGTTRSGRVWPRWEETKGPLRRRRLVLPWQLPWGYHRLWVRAPGLEGRTRVIVAPQTAYLPPQPRMWGVFLPLYALASRHSWGSGDLNDLHTLCRWVKSLGGTMVGTLPLLPTLWHEPYDISPYSPASRLFWNEMYLAPQGLPERALVNVSWAQERQWAAVRARLKRQRLVDYPQAMAVKRQLLEALSQSMVGLPSREACFQQWIDAHPRARDYAAFCAAKDLGQTPPLGCERAGHAQASRLRRYHLYVQWNLEEQMARLGEDNGLYLDFPLGVHGEGYDVWRWPQLFAPASVGAPPDAFFAGGQDWGFRPLHPERMRDEGYDYLIACLRHHLRWAHSLRLDHVSWLRRLFWIPGGGTAKDGVYVRYPQRELYAILCLESQRHRTLLVGEDLGTMPPGLGRELVGHSIQRTYVLGLEKAPLRRASLARSRLAGLNTHDLPTFRTFWQSLSKGQRLAWWQRLGRERGGRRSALTAALQHLAASRSRVVLINLEDLWGEKEQQNRPGRSSSCEVNWRRKAALTLEEITGCVPLRAMLGRANRLRPALWYRHRLGKPPSSRS